MRKLFLGIGFVMLLGAFTGLPFQSGFIHSGVVKPVKTWTGGPYDDDVEAQTALTNKKNDLVANGNTIVAGSDRTWWEPGPPDGEGRYYFATVKYNTSAPVKYGGEKIFKKVL